MDGYLFKVDFEKAYDKIKRFFVASDAHEMLWSYMWCRWINNFVQGDNVGIRVNVDIEHFFPYSKRLETRGRVVSDDF
jgi:hypothetical protein